MIQMSSPSQQLKPQCKSVLLSSSSSVVAVCTSMMMMMMSLSIVVVVLILLLTTTIQAETTKTTIAVAATSSSTRRHHYLFDGWLQQQQQQQRHIIFPKQKQEETSWTQQQQQQQQQQHVTSTNPIVDETKDIPTSVSSVSSSSVSSLSFVSRLFQSRKKHMQRNPNRRRPSNRHGTSSNTGIVLEGEDSSSLLLQECCNNSAKRRTLLFIKRGGGGGSNHDQIKTMTTRQMEFLNLISGGAAGTVAACITNPLEVIKTRLQASVVPSVASSSSVASSPSLLVPLSAIQTTRQILQVDGWSGFFRGITPTLIGIIPSRSAYFYTYNRCKAFLDHPFTKRDKAITIFPAGSIPNALLSGFMAGIVGNTITNPIWMIRTRMQLQANTDIGQVVYTNYYDIIRNIYQTEGISGFYRGLQASYWGCTEGAIQFILYEQMKKKLLQYRNQQLKLRSLPETNELTNGMYFWSAASAKMIASMITYPHEVARTRLREQSRMGLYKYMNMWQTIRTIAIEEGRTGLYSGMNVHLLKVVPNSALMFLTYEIVRTWLSEYTIVD